MQWEVASSEGNFIDTIAVHPWSIQHSDKIVFCILPNNY